MRIATFNLLHGQPLDGGQPLPFPVPGDDAGAPLAEAVGGLDVDVLAMQEVDRYQERSGMVDQAAVAAAAIGAQEWRFAAALHGRPAPVAGWVLDPGTPELKVYGPGDDGIGIPSAYGTALVTRLPVRHWRARRFAPAPFGLPLRVAGRAGLTTVPDEPRAALAAVLEARRGPFTVVAAHLSFVPGWNMGQLAAIRRWIADLPGPYLLLGDLNLVGAVPRTVLGGAAVVDSVTRRGQALPRGRGVLTQRRGRSAGRRPDGAAMTVRTVNSRTVLRGWRDLARVATYPSHRPTVQFDHVLAVGVPRDAVRAARTPMTPISDHRPLVVELDL